MAGMKLFELFGVIDIDDNGADAQLDTTDKKASTLGTTLGKVGKGAVGAGKVIGTSMLAVAGGVAVATAKISETTDAIDKGAQNIGFSTDAYQEWGYVLTQSGSDMETVAGGISALTEKAVDAAEGGTGNAEAFAKLGLSIEELQGLTQEEIFEKTIKGLQGMTDETKRAALASELMGGAGEELGALLNSTTDDIIKMKEEANEMGFVLGEDAVAGGVAMTDSIDQMKRTVESTLINALGPMIPMVMELIETFVEILPPLMEFIQPLIEKLVPVVTQIIEKLLPVFISLLDALMPVLDPLIDIFLVLLDSALLPLIEALLPLIETLLPPLALLLEAVVPIVTSLAKVIGGALVVAVDSVSDAFEWLFDKLGPVFELLGAIGDVVGDVISGVGDAIMGGGSTTTYDPYDTGMSEPSYMPSYAVGTDYVPYDMVAQIHKGEAIITAEENASGRGGQTINLIVNNPQVIGDQGIEDFTNIMVDYVKSNGVLA